MWQRSEDDETWVQVDEATCRDRISGSYRNVQQIIDEMRSNPGRVVRTTFAFYRFIAETT